MAVNDKLDWNNPDPYDYRYIEHIYNMFAERVVVSRTSQSNFSPDFRLSIPSKYTFCNKKLYETIRNFIEFSICRRCLDRR